MIGIKFDVLFIIILWFLVFENLNLVLSWGFCFDKFFVLMLLVDLLGK